MCSVLVLGLLISVFQISIASTPASPADLHRRYEYIYSFKGPLLVQKDGLIPFWEHGGHAIPSEDKVRLAPSMRNKRGHLWSKKRANFDGFEVDMSFRITGRGKVGADGLAMWFVEEKTQGGPVYGLSDKWKGIGIFFDTYDNDGQLNNPIITAMLNDGTKTYEHDVDGEGQYLASCIRDFRNRPFPILIRLRYYKKELSLFINNGNTDSKADMQECFAVKNVELPGQGYFGVSAATGELADDHDVMSFEVHSLTTKETPGSKTVPDQEREKYEKEFKDHMEKMKKAQDEYKKLHKDDKKKYRPEGDEAEEVRRLRQIWVEQTAIHVKVDGIANKMDQIIKQLESIGGGKAPTSGGEVPHDLVRKSDLNEAKEHMTSAISDMRHVVEKIQPPSKSQDGGGSAFYELRQMSHDLRESLDTVKENIRQIDLKIQPNTPKDTSTCPTCLTTSVFVTVTVMNALIIIGAIFFKLNQESSAKKFY